MVTTLPVQGVGQVSPTTTRPRAEILPAAAPTPTTEAQNAIPEFPTKKQLIDAIAMNFDKPGIVQGTIQNLPHERLLVLLHNVRAEQEARQAGKRSQMLQVSEIGKFLS